MGNADDRGRFIEEVKADLARIGELISAAEEEVERLFDCSDSCDGAILVTEVLMLMSYEVPLGPRGQALRLPDQEAISEALAGAEPRPWTVGHCALNVEPRSLTDDEPADDGHIEFLGCGVPPDTDHTGWISPRGDLFRSATSHTHLRLATSLLATGILPTQEFWPTGKPGRIEDYAGKDWAIKEHLFRRGWVRWWGRRLYGHASAGLGFELTEDRMDYLRAVLALMEPETEITVVCHEKRRGKARTEATIQEFLADEEAPGNG